MIQKCKNNGIKNGQMKNLRSVETTLEWMKSA